MAKLFMFWCQDCYSLQQKFVTIFVAAVDGEKTHQLFKNCCVLLNYSFVRKELWDLSFRPLHYKKNYPQALNIVGFRTYGLINYIKSFEGINNADGDVHVFFVRQDDSCYFLEACHVLNDAQSDKENEEQVLCDFNILDYLEQSDGQGTLRRWDSRALLLPS